MIMIFVFFSLLSLLFTVDACGTGPADFDIKIRELYDIPIAVAVKKGKIDGFPTMPKNKAQLFEKMKKFLEGKIQSAYKQIFNGNMTLKAENWLDIKNFLECDNVLKSTSLNTTPPTSVKEGKTTCIVDEEDMIVGVCTSQKHCINNGATPSFRRIPPKNTFLSIILHTNKVQVDPWKAFQDTEGALKFEKRLKELINADAEGLFFSADVHVSITASEIL